MYSPATRLLRVLELLQARPGMTSEQLAERLQVNTRSARRYITMLQDLGIPVESTRGRYGGYHLRPGFRLPPLMFTDEEALAVTLGLLAARRLGLSHAAPAVEGALAKVERVLPQAVREQVQAVQETVMLDLAVPKVMPTADHVMMMSKAAHKGQRVAIQYQNNDGQQSERKLDCYGLVYRDVYWYVVGYCHLRQEVRVFRLDRMLTIELCPEHFVPPKGFNCLDYAVQSFAAIPDTWFVEVLLETTLDQIRWSVPPSFATLEEQANGLLLRTYDNSLEHTARFLVGLGCPFTVQQPLELLDALEQLAANITYTIRQQVKAYGK